MILAAYFILRGRETHIDFLRLLFLVGVLCPLMQEYSLRLKKLISHAQEDAMLKIRRSESRATYRPKQRCKSNLSTVSVHANRSSHQDLIHSGCRGTMVPNVCLQPLTLSLSSPREFFNLSPNREPVHRLRNRRSMGFNLLPTTIFRIFRNSV